MSRMPELLDARARPAAIHVGRRDHYRLACELVARHPRRAVLVQRSSTLLLGPEAGWDHEADFHHAVWRSVEHGTAWHHIASLHGIERHLSRRTSEFPSARSLPSHVVTSAGVLAIGVDGDAQPIKVLPDEATVDLGDDFKLDRQIRVLAAELDDGVEALVVSDVGDQQVTIHLDGEPAARLLDVCLDFYDRCPPLHAADLRACLDRAAPER